MTSLGVPLTPGDLSDGSAAACDAPLPSHDWRPPHRQKRRVPCLRPLRSRAPRRLRVGERSGRAGLDYLLAAQYPNGGWPQFYPLRSDYSRHITFNDDAMTDVLALLEDVANARALPFAEDAHRLRAAKAIDTAL